MNKQEFLAQLRRGLAGLPQEDIEDRLSFYGEMIEDRIEEGVSEEEAVMAVGSVSEVVAQVVTEIPFAKIAKERIKDQRTIKMWEVILLVLGSPVWLSLGVALIAVILALYASLWSVIISLWVVFASMIACALSGLAAGVGFACSGAGLQGLAMMGAGLVLAGLAILMFYGCNAASDGIIFLTGKIALWIKNCMIKKEDAQ